MLEDPPLLVVRKLVTRLPADKLAKLSGAQTGHVVDAMDGRGALDIHADPIDDGGVQVRICDTGPGIPQDILPRLFEPFFTTKAPGVGTGLGLHITHSVVSRHGGRIEVSSDPGKGTCFTVTLPPTVGPAQDDREREGSQAQAPA
jgi:nitrogen-specific signal transduction histidine kinase